MEEKTTVILDSDDLNQAIADYLKDHGYEAKSFKFQNNFATGQINGCEVVVIKTV